MGIGKPFFFFLLRYDRHELRGGHWGLWFLLFFKIGFSVFVPKNVGFSGFVVHCVSRISVFSIWFSVFVKHFDGYLNLVSDVLFRFLILGFRFLSDLNSSYAPLLILNSRETYVAPLVTTVSDRLGF